MADIELAIKMPEEVYKSIINGKNYISYQEYVEEAIKNGTPLPKRHGRLIDMDKLCNDLIKRWKTADKKKEIVILSVMADVVTPIIVSQPTILEATEGIDADIANKKEMV